MSKTSLSKKHAGALVPPQWLKASETLIAWTPADSEPTGKTFKAPAGSIAVGPIIDDWDWAYPYSCTGGAAWVHRRYLHGMAQQLAVMRDWYQLVYSEGLHPYIVHRAFLLIDEYQTMIKQWGCGPDKGEPGHDPNVLYGRCVVLPTPELIVKQTKWATHFWPTGE
jgi:hypothetical protein